MSIARTLSADEKKILSFAAREIKEGSIVNLGIGLPTFIPNFIPSDLGVLFHSENGFIGMGAHLEDGTPDHHTIDSGGAACSLVEGASCFDSVVSFTIIRGGHLDLAILGAFEVSVAGDLANWKIPGKFTPGMGGAMELAQKAKQVVVVSRLLDKKGRCKIVSTCSLPLTAIACVDTVVTERAIFRRRGNKLKLCEVVSSQELPKLKALLPEELDTDSNLVFWNDADE